MKTKKFWVVFLAAIILSAAACDKKTEEQLRSTVSVSGTGTVMVRPDMVQMTVSLARVARTTKQAQEEVSVMVRQTLEILKNSGIEDKNISTASLTFNPEYEYGNNGRELIGQKAEQRITFTVDNIQDGDKNISGIIDQLIGINGIELNDTSFNIKNNTEYFVRSRELAFQKALEKAEQYAELSGLKIDRVVNISEEGNQPVFPISNRMVNQMSLAATERSGAGSTVLPAGELEVTSRITVMFLLAEKDNGPAR